MQRQEVDVRIIAGAYRGRVLVAPEGLDTRPTTDRVRESIMSSLYSMLGGFEDVHALDAFSGSGAMGLEAISRGAVSCVLNDCAKTSRDAIRRNRDALGLDDRIAPISNVDVLLSGLPFSPTPYDLVFLDPPYKTDALEMLATIQQALSRGQLAEGCVIVYERGEKLDEDLPSVFGLSVAGEKKCGKTFVTYLTIA